MTGDFYRKFEDKYRGSRELIKLRQKFYFPFVDPVLNAYPEAGAFDIGCGRGEWLELLRDKGHYARGMDINQDMLKACFELGLDVALKDGIASLKEFSDASLAVITAFHVVEHIPFDQLKVLVEHAYRVLRPGGLLILETPNPENIVMGTNNFYLDPTHQNPIPRQLLSFIPEYCGFDYVKVLRLNESPENLDISNISPHYSILCGVSPDYAVLAQKGGSEKLRTELAPLLKQDYGLSLSKLAGVIQQHTEAKANTIKTLVTQANERAAQANTRAEQAEASAAQANTRTEQAGALAAQVNTRAEQAEASAAQANTRAEQAAASAAQANTCAEQAQAAAHHAAMRYQTIINSRTWRMTAPLRWVMDKVKWFVRGSAAWITLRPGSRPRRTARLALLHLRNWVLKRPRAKARVLRTLRHFPRLKLWLKRLHHTNPIQGVQPTAPLIAGDVPIEEPLKHLSPRARKIYADLRSAMARQQQGSN